MNAIVGFARQFVWNAAASSRRKERDEYDEM